MHVVHQRYYPRRSDQRRSPALDVASGERPRLSNTSTELWAMSSHAKLSSGSSVRVCLLLEHRKIAERDGRVLPRLEVLLELGGCVQEALELAGDIGDIQARRPAALYRCINIVYSVMYSIEGCSCCVLDLLGLVRKGLLMRLTPSQSRPSFHSRRACSGC